MEIWKFPGDQGDKKEWKYGVCGSNKNVSLEIKGMKNIFFQEHYSNFLHISNSNRNVHYKVY